MARTVTFKGKTLHLLGPEINLGDSAPNATCMTADLQPISGEDVFGKVILISVTPSLDTPVCDLQARHFNEAAAALGSDVVVVNISVDLPFAIKRWCGASGSERIRAVSDYRDREFGRSWGVLIDELKLLARAVFVVDRYGRVAYKQIVPEVTDEPDYEAALAAVEAIR